MHGKRPAGVALLVGLLIAGSAGRGRGQQQLVPQPSASPAPTGQEITGHQIVAVEFHCAAPIDREGLLQLMPMHVGDLLRAGDLEQARWHLGQTQIFTDVTVETGPRGAGVAVVVHLVRKAIINAVRFRGNRALSDDDLHRAGRLHAGTVLTDEMRDGAVTRIRERYVAEGFEAARVTAATEVRSPGEVDVTVRIREGPPLRIRAIEIEGAPLPLKAVQESLGIKVGHRFTRAGQRQAQTAIVRLLRSRRYYEADVDSRWERGEGHGGVLRFSINAGPPFQLRFSGNHHFSDTELMELMDLPARPIITDGTWRELARRARRAYQEAGYYFARVDLHVDPGPPKVVRLDVDEGESFRVAEVSLEGNHALAADLLHAQMATRPPSWIPWRHGIFLDDVFEDDLRRLWFFYRRYGFEDAQIVDTRTRFERGRVHVTVFIEEGRQTIVREVIRLGTELIAGELPEFQVKVDGPLDPDHVEADRRALLTAFARAGYTRAQVTASVSTAAGEAAHAATVRYSAAAGEQERVGKIIVQNNLETRARVIARELPFKSGDPLNPDALLRGQSNIYRLGLFRSVTVRPLETAAEEPAPAPVRNIGVSVAEKPAGTLQWGTGYNTRDGIRGFLEVGHGNLQGRARRLSLRGEVNFDPSSASPDEYIGNLGFREPRVDETQWMFRSNLVAQRSTRSVDQFSVERFAFIPGLERTMLPGLQAGGELQFEQSQVFDVKPDVLAFNPSDAGRLRTISVNPFAVYDGRDDPFVPRHGVFDSLRLKFAPEEFGSDVPFVKLVGQHSQYIPVDDDVTFVYALRGGWARAYAGGDQLPIRERFFLGGRTTVRGFGENTIGPQGSQGNPLGGDLVLNLNTELRFPLLFGLGGALFVDGGGVYLHDRAVSLHDFRRATGLGLRYITPVGPISLEYGFKLDRRADESIGEVHFSIGTIF